MRWTVASKRSRNGVRAWRIAVGSASFLGHVRPLRTATVVRTMAALNASAPAGSGATTSPSRRESRTESDLVTAERRTDRSRYGS